MNYFLKTASVAATAVALTSVAAFADDGELTVFDWAGYEDPEFFAAYVAQHGEGPTFAFFGDEEEAFQKIALWFSRRCSASLLAIGSKMDRGRSFGPAGYQPDHALG